MWTFAKDPPFRTTLAARIREVQEREITLWPPLALVGTFRLALEILLCYSSWLNLQVSVFHLHFLQLELTR